MAVSSVQARAQAFFDERRSDNRDRLKKVLIGGVVVALYPLLDNLLGLGLLPSLIPVVMYALLAMGLNIVVGYAGLLDIGYVAFFIIGVYAQAFFTSPNSIFVRNGFVPEFMQGFWVAMLFSWVLAAIFGVLIGAPTLRLRGDYLAIVTLGFGEIVPDFFTNAAGITGGPRGIGQIARPPSIPLPGGNEISFSSTNHVEWYYLLVAVGLLSLFMITRLYDSRMGRAWQAIREDEIAAASVGIHPVTTKLWAFALGASFAGFAGSVYAGYVQVVYPDQFQFSLSILVLAMVILGGIGNIYGVLAGALIIGLFDRILAVRLTGPMQALGRQMQDLPGFLGSIGNFFANHSLTSDRFLIFGLALVLVMVLRPGGLFPSKQRAAEMRGDDDNFDFDDYETNQALRDARAKEA
jgi:branched-chain amino acid transport system permease protein